MGTKNLCFVYNNQKEVKEIKESRVKISKAFFANKNSIISLRNNFTLMKSALRQDIELKPNLVISNEKIAVKDNLHYRHSGLDQVMCRIMAKEGIIYGINFNDVLNADSEQRAVLMGRMMQNIDFCRKYKVKVVIGSFALKPYELRSFHDLEAFGAALGMNPGGIVDGSLSTLLK